MRSFSRSSDSSSSNESRSRNKSPMCRFSHTPPGRLVKSQRKDSGHRFTRSSSDSQSSRSDYARSKKSICPSASAISELAKQTQQLLERQKAAELPTDHSSFKPRIASTIQSKLERQIQHLGYERSTSPSSSRKPASIALVKSALYWKPSGEKMRISHSPRRAIQSLKRSPQSPQRESFSIKSASKNSYSYISKESYKAKSLAHRNKDAVDGSITLRSRSRSHRIEKNSMRFTNRNPLPQTSRPMIGKMIGKYQKKTFKDYCVDPRDDKMDRRLSRVAGPFYHNPLNEFPRRSPQQTSLFRDTSRIDSRNNDHSIINEPRQRIRNQAKESRVVPLRVKSIDDPDRKRLNNNTEDRAETNVGNFRKAIVHTVQNSSFLTFKSIERNQCDRNSQYATGHEAKRMSFRDVPPVARMAHGCSVESTHAIMPEKSSIEWKSLSAANSKDVDLRTITSLSTPSFKAGVNACKLYDQDSRVVGCSNSQTNMEKGSAGPPNLMELKFTQFHNINSNSIPLGPTPNSLTNKSEFSLRFINRPNDRLQGLSPDVDKTPIQHAGLLNSDEYKRRPMSVNRGNEPNIRTGNTVLQFPPALKINSGLLRKDDERCPDRDTVMKETYSGMPSEKDGRRVMFLRDKDERKFIPTVKSTNDLSDTVEGTIMSRNDVDGRILCRGGTQTDRKRVSSLDHVEDVSAVKTARLSLTAKPHQETNDGAGSREVGVKQSSASFPSAKPFVLIPENVTIVRKRSEVCRPFHVREEFIGDSPDQLDAELLKGSKLISMMFTPSDTAPVSSIVRRVVDSFLEEHPLITTHKQIEHTTSLTLNERFNSAPFSGETKPATLNKRFDIASGGNRLTNKTDTVLGVSEKIRSTVEKQTGTGANRLVKLVSNAPNHFSADAPAVNSVLPIMTNITNSLSSKSQVPKNLNNVVLNEKSNRGDNQFDERRIFRAVPAKTQLTDMRFVRMATKPTDAKPKQTAVGNSMWSQLSQKPLDGTSACLDADFKSFGVRGVFSTSSLDGRFGMTSVVPPAQTFVPSAIRLDPDTIKQRSVVVGSKSVVTVYGQGNAKAEVRALQESGNKKFRRPSDYLMNPVVVAAQRKDETLGTRVVQRFGEKLVSPPTLRETPVPHQSGRISPIVPPSLASSSSTAIKQRGSGKPIVTNLRATLSSAPIPDKRSTGAASQRRVTVAAPSPAQMIIKSAVVTSTAPVLRTTVSVAASKQSFDLRLKLSGNSRQKTDDISTTTTQNHNTKNDVGEADRRDVRSIMLTSPTTSGSNQDARTSSDKGSVSFRRSRIVRVSPRPVKQPYRSIVLQRSSTAAAATGASNAKDWSDNEDEREPTSTSAL